MGREPEGPREAEFRHEPVLRAEVVDLVLGDRSGPLRIVDATLGLGGHSEALLSGSADVQVLGIDRDPAALERAQARLAPFGDRFRPVQSGFADLPDALATQGWDGADGLVADLGVSSMQLDDASRGFSFRADASLDMRMDPSRGRSAAELLSEVDAGELADLLRHFGDVPNAGRVARAILREPVPQSTVELRERIPVQKRGRRLHDPATLVFQALRIAVNGELEQLDALLSALPDGLAPSARVVILSYHSLEDRRVKRAFQRWQQACICPPAQPICRCGGQPEARALVRGAMKASEEEIASNPRARSVRLRAMEWIGGR